MCNPAKCGCRGTDCCNPHTYDLSKPEQVEKHKAAIRRVAEDKQAQFLARIEAGHL